MAKQTGLFRFTGKLDNVIGYRRNGVHCVRSMPEKVRQTAATRRAARQFGACSRRAKLIREAITPYIDMRYDGTLVNRLNKALVFSGSRQLQGIAGFRFSRHRSLEQFFNRQPFLSVSGLLTIPAQELPKPGGATHLEVCVIAARINFAEQRIIGVETALELIDLNAAFNGLELSAPVGGKGTLIVTVQVRACMMRNGKITASGDRRYMAADIISVVPASSVMACGRRVSAGRGHSSQRREGFPSPSLRGPIRPCTASNLPSLRGPQTALSQKSLRPKQSPATQAPGDLVSPEIASSPRPHCSAAPPDGHGITSLRGPQTALSQKSLRPKQSPATPAPGDLVSPEIASSPRPHCPTAPRNDGHGVTSLQSSVRPYAAPGDEATSRITGPFGCTAYQRVGDCFVAPPASPAQLAMTVCNGPRP